MWKLLSQVGMVLPLALVGGGCNDAGFKGGAAKREAQGPTVDPKGRTPVDKSFKLNCLSDGGDAPFKTNLSGLKSMTVRLEGEFCGINPKITTGTVSIFFVIDQSGSMRLSDPTSGGSCGRLQATQALLDKLAKSAQPGVSMSAGMAVFGGSARVSVPLGPLASFRSTISANEICRQDGGTTNYEAALAATKAAINATSGQKLVYFISDGLPSAAGVPGSGGFLPVGGAGGVAAAYDAGARAAEDLRSVSDLTLNVVYLDSAEARAQSEQASGAPIEDPASYLKKIAGSQDRVKLVTSASDLASQILTFDSPKDVTLEQSSVRGELAAKGYTAKTVKLESLTKDPSRSGIWLFATEPFKLFGKSGATVENVVTFDVQGEGDKTYKAQALLNFTADD